MLVLSRKKIVQFFALIFLLSAGIWSLGLGNYFLKLPDNFNYTARINSVDNFFDESTQNYKGEQFSSTTYSYQVDAVTDKGLILKNLFDVRDSSGAEIFSVQRLYGIDPYTGAHVQGLGDEDRTGYLFAPRNLQAGQSFVYWHISYDAPAEMQYVGEENLYGLPVYHYLTHYEGQLVDQTKELSYLDKVPEERGIRIEPTLELWVEPLTGSLIKYQDESTAYYYDIQTGEDLFPWNHFQNSFAEESVKTHVSEALQEKFFTLMVQKAVPFGLLILAILTLLYSERDGKTKLGAVNPIISVFMTVLPIVAVLFGWYSLKQEVEQKAELAFNNSVSNVEDAIGKRMEIAINTLEGTEGLFSASQNVSREEWKVYVSKLELETKYPGVQAVGYAPLVNSEAKESFMESIRAEGFSDFAIYPPGDRTLYFPVTYAEPLNEKNRMALGYDMYSENTRKLAMDAARDTGEPTLTGKITLVIEDEKNPQAGFNIYVPLYQKDLPHVSLAERQKALVGYTYSPFRAEDFIKGIFGSMDLGLSFNFYDGTEITEENLMVEWPSDDTPAYFTKTDTLLVAGHPWTFVFTGHDSEFAPKGSEKWLVYGSLIVGLIAAALYILIYYSLLISRQRIIEFFERRKR